MERWDLYDENRNPLGITMARDEPVQPGRYHVVVGIWIFSSDHRILLTKRSSEKKFAPNTWENTGGHVMAGETSEEAVLRELWEETGIPAEKTDLTFLGSVCIPPEFGDNYAVRKDVDLGDVKLQPGETCDARWVTLNEFNHMAQTGEVAASVVEYLAPIREKWEAVLNM